MKIKSRIYRQTIIQLSEKDYEQLHYEYGQMNNSLPLVRQIIANIAGDIQAEPMKEYLD